MDENAMLLAKIYEAIFESARKNTTVPLARAISELEIAARENDRLQSN